MGARIPNTSIRSPSQYRTFWSLEFKWFGFGMVRTICYSYSYNRPFQNRTIQNPNLWFGFWMVWFGFRATILKHNHSTSEQLLTIRNTNPFGIQAPHCTSNPPRNIFSAQQGVVHQIYLHYTAKIVMPQAGFRFTVNKGVSIARWLYTGFRFQGNAVQIPAGEKITPLSFFCSNLMIAIYPQILY